MINVVGSTPSPISPLPPTLPGDVPAPPVAQAESTNTPPQSNSPLTPKKKTPWRSIIAGIVLFITIVGAGIGFYLTQQNQDIRQQAAGKKCGFNGIINYGGCSGGYKCSASSGHGTCIQDSTSGADRVLTQNTAQRTPTPVKTPTPTPTPTPKNDTAGADRVLTQNTAQRTPTPVKTPTPKDDTSGADRVLTQNTATKKSNGSTCNSNVDCVSNNCQAAPGGKYCIPAGTTTNVIRKEGESCAVTAYDRQCETGTTCQNNKCVRTSGGGGSGSGAVATQNNSASNNDDQDEDDNGGGTVTPPPSQDTDDNDNDDKDNDDSDTIADAGGSRQQTSSPTPTPEPVVLPSTLPETGPEDWLKYLQIGLGVLGVGALLLLFL